MITGVSCRVHCLLLIATVPSVDYVLPFTVDANLGISTLIMYILMVKLSNAEFWPTAFLWVMLSNIFYAFGGIWLARQFGL